MDQHISDKTSAGIEEDLRRINPGIVIFDVSSLNEEASDALSRKISGQAGGEGIVLIAVGHAPSADTDTFRERHPQFQVVLAGEAEQEAVKIIYNIRTGMSGQDIRHRYDAPELARQIWTVCDLDALPFPDYNQRELRQYTFVYPLKLAKHIVWGHILSSRGCPHGCVFCSQIMRESYGTEVRLRSAVNVVDEMEQLLHSGANVLSFDDDNFTNSPSHVQAICEEILRRKIKIHWIAHARVDEIDAPLLCLMQRSGCILLRYGVETASRNILENLGKTPDPHTWPEKTREAVRLTQAQGIAAVCLFMIGCPGETHEDLESNIRFARDLDPDIIQVAYFTPFPGSRYYATFKKKFSGQNVSELYHYNTPRVNLSRMKEREFQSAQILFYKKFLLRPAFIGKHILRYFVFYVFNPRIFSELSKIEKNFFQPDGCRS